MKPVRIAKITLDAVMFLLFILLMGQHLLSGAVHEYLGAGLFVCFIIHNALNFKWYKGLFKGKHSVQCSVLTAVNILLVISVVVCLLSSPMISGVIFRDIRIEGAMMQGRQLHMVSTAWCFVLMSVHLGLHIRAPKQKVQKVCFYIAMLTASTVGVYHFIVRKFYEELFLLAAFKWFDYDKTLIGYLFETVCISHAFGMIAYFLKKFSRRRTK